MKKCRIIYSDKTDPWFNLALEEYLVDSVSEDADSGIESFILYLWQNDNTVVIGRNQNAWAECRSSLLEKEGGKLARRSTGGGAVYHDLGNLNFSIITPKQKYDISRSLGIIVKAAKEAGVEALRSGRNDILAGGQKFSGNAFLIKKNAGLHHGTLLIDSDHERVARYLNVPKAKLESKGIRSVRSRIINLSDIKDDITVDKMKTSTENAFIEEYGFEDTEIIFSADIAGEPKFREMNEKYASWQWRYGESIAFSAVLEKYFAWGNLQMCFNVKNGKIAEAKIYTDAIDGDYFSQLANDLTGIRFTSDRIAEIVMACEESRPLRDMMDHDIREDIKEFIFSSDL